MAAPENAPSADPALPTSAPPVLDWAPDQPEMLHDVHGNLDAQRRRCPVPLARSLGGDLYYSALTYDDIVRVVTDKSAFSSAANVLREELRRIPVELDPPEHTVMRRMLQPYFVPARMRALQPAFEEMADELLAELLAPLAPGESGTVDYAEGFATPYPTRVLCALLGLPDEDWRQVKEWSLAVASQGFTTGRGPDHAEANAALTEYVQAVLADRRANPRPVEEDMTSGMLAARPKGEPLSDEQITGVLRLMVAAGHLTTTHAMGIVTRYLAENPRDQARLRGNPGDIPAAIEEILRHCSPTTANTNPRTVVAPVTIGGRDLVPGDRMLPVWGGGKPGRGAVRESGDGGLRSRAGQDTRLWARHTPVPGRSGSPPGTGDRHPGIACRDHGLRDRRGDPVRRLLAAARPYAPPPQGHQSLMPPSNGHE